MLKKTFFIASAIILIVAYVQLSSFYTEIHQASRIIVIDSKTSPTESDEIIKKLFNSCDIHFQSMLAPDIYVRHSEFNQKKYYRLSDLREPIHQSVELVVKELDNSHNVDDHIFYLLESPTLEALKRLRRDIDVNVKPAMLASAFDRVIPILPIPANLLSDRCELIQNYIIYTEYVFGGVGFLV